MSLEVTNESAICYKCGSKYSRRKGYFPVSYSLLNKGVGYTPICKDCIDSLYNSYLAQSKDARLSVRQVCRKLDLYWSDKVYDVVERKNTTRTMMTQYIAKINTVSYVGKSYDDTLSEEGTLWTFKEDENTNTVVIPVNTESKPKEDIDVPEEVVSFWGAGYSPETYEELEQKRKRLTSKLTGGDEDAELDIGTEVYIKQICLLDLDISRDRAAGKSVDKNLTVLNTLLGSANLKPVQRNKQEDIDSSILNTPMGVWLYRYENERPLPEVDEDLQDVNKLRKYIFTWMGHLCKMLGVKNAYTQLYEDEIARLRVEKPEYDGDDDEVFMTDLFMDDSDTKKGEE